MPPSDSQGGNQRGVAQTPERSRHGTLVVEPQDQPDAVPEKLTPAPVRSVSSKPPPAPSASRYRTHVGIGVPTPEPMPAVPPAPRPAAGAPPPPSSRGVPPANPGALQPIRPVPMQAPKLTAPTSSAPGSSVPHLSTPKSSAPGSMPFSAEDEEEATVVMDRSVAEAGRYSLVPGQDGRLHPSSHPPRPAAGTPITPFVSPIPPASPAPLMPPTPTIPDNPKPQPPERKRSFTPTQVGMAPFEEEEDEPRAKQPSVADLLESELAAHGLATPGPTQLAPGATALDASPSGSHVVAPDATGPRQAMGSMTDGFGQHKAYDPTRAYPELPSAAPYEPSPASMQTARSEVSVNKWLYRAAVFGGLVLSVALGVVPVLKPSLGLVAAAAPLGLLIGWVSQFVLLYKCWKSIQDGNARTTPGKAVGLLFVPLFNLYWVFNVLPGFATDFNRYIQRHRVDTPPLNQNLILAAMVVPGLGAVLWWIVIGKLCDGVNALRR
ncbi:MAG: hypothetical protein R3B07_03720 [Polyangiaceae bacterium]